MYCVANLMNQLKFSRKNWKPSEGPANQHETPSDSWWQNPVKLFVKRKPPCYPSPSPITLSPFTVQQAFSERKSPNGSWWYDDLESVTFPNAETSSCLILSQDRGCQWTAGYGMISLTLVYAHISFRLVLSWEWEPQRQLMITHLFQCKDLLLSYPVVSVSEKPSDSWWVRTSDHTPLLMRRLPLVP